MTFPPPQMPPAYGLAQPPKLSWVTVPLIVQMVLSVLGIILLPLIIPFFSAMMSDPSFSQDSSTSPADLRFVVTFFSAFVWVFEVVQIAFLVLYFFTYRAVQQGRSWGRIVAIVVFILNVLNFPFGTLIGVFGLIGAFDPEVTAYCNR